MVETLATNQKKTQRKKKKKGEFTEEDVCDLLQRYEAKQVLALLHELAQSPELKIDWNALVSKTTSGITNARECQLLWRHLAYRQPLVHEIEHGAQPLDDDSDLEYEVKPYPPVITEFAKEVANCVKVLASGSPNESSMPNSSVVAGDLHKGHSSIAPSENRQPVSLLHSSNNFSSRRKRKNWSYQDDLELTAAVKKCGEGYWTAIAKEFKGDRSASQLWQRWKNIKKKRTLDAVGASPQLWKLLATGRAIDMALKDNLTGRCVVNGAAATSNHANINAPNGNAPINTTCVNPGPMGMTKSLPPLKRAPTIPRIDDPIQAAAVAAGARIGSPLDAQNLFKAAQSKKVVHVIGGSSLAKNVHFIRAGLARTRPTSMAAGSAPHPPAPGGGNQAKGSLVNPTVQVSHVKPAGEIREDVAVALPRCLPEAPGMDSEPGKQTVDADKSICAICKSKIESERKDVNPDKSICATCKGKIESECKDVSPVDNEKRSKVQESCDCVSGLDDSSDCWWDVLPDIVLDIDFRDIE